jgi:hypothetical protein
MFGDTEQTLSPWCHEQSEAHANYGAGGLLFFQDDLRDFSSLSTPNFALVQEISITATRFRGKGLLVTLIRAATSSGQLHSLSGLPM